MTTDPTDPWHIIQKAFDNFRCPDDCPHLHTWNEPRPYGDTTVNEPMSECDLLNDGGDPIQCPVYCNDRDPAD